MSTALTELRAAVSVEELKRAWTAIQAGQFRAPTAAGARTAPVVTTLWSPAPNERVVPVVGCAGSCGASTLAVALATAATVPARVIECSSATASGLAAASTAELGAHPSGWLRGTRGMVLLERADGVLAGVEHVPTPSTPERQMDLTVLDVGWEFGQVLASSSWLRDQISGADPVVLVSTATIPGLRRLEGVVAMLAGTAAVAAVVGPRRRKWPRSLEHSAGPLTRALDEAGHLIDVPADRDLSTAGLDTTPLPQPLLDAAAHLLGYLQPSTKGSPR